MAEPTARVKTPPEPGAESAGPAFVQLTRELQRTQAEMHALTLAVASRWTRLVAVDSQTTDSSTGNATFKLEPVAQGFEGEIERVVVSVAGASHAAHVAVYRGNGAQEGNLLDYQDTLLGDSPSRRALLQCPAIRIQSGEILTVVITGAVTSQQAYARAEGRKREVL